MQHNLQTASGKVAFVLGNGAYVHTDPLAKPKNDAKQFRNALHRLGFTVFPDRGYDLDTVDLRKQLDAFIKATTKCRVALVYYSGHGLQINGVNYIVPIDADIDSDEFIESLVSIQKLISRVSRPDSETVIFLDACRDNPFAINLNTSRERRASAKGLAPPAALSTGQGLAQISEGGESIVGPTYIAFATAPGEVAGEGHGEISIFTEGLLTHIQTQDLSIDNLMRRVTKYVGKMTEDQQKPWSLSSLDTPFYFYPGSLIWLNSSLIAITAIAAAILTYSISLYSRAELPFVAVSLFIVLLTFLAFVVGLSRAYDFARGEFESVEERRTESSLFGGLLGGVIAGPIVGLAYFYDWHVAAASTDFGWGSPDPIGKVVSEVSAATVAAGLVLGPLSYLSATRLPIWLRLNRPQSNQVLLWCGILGGIAAGLFIGPIITLYFGRLERPYVTARVLLPGGIVSTAIAVFAILNYNFERSNYSKMVRNGVSALLSTVAISVVSGLIFYLIDGFVVSSVNLVLDNTAPPILVLIGVIVGSVLGAILGCTLVLAIILSNWMEDRALRTES